MCVTSWKAQDFSQNSDDLRKSLASSYILRANSRRGNFLGIVECVLTVGSAFVFEELYRVLNKTHPYTNLLDDFLYFIASTLFNTFKYLIMYISMPTFSLCSQLVPGTYESVL